MITWMILSVRGVTESLAAKYETPVHTRTDVWLLTQDRENDRQRCRTFDRADSAVDKTIDCRSCADHDPYHYK